MKTLAASIICAAMALPNTAQAEQISTKDQSWKDLVAYAIGQSSLQNNGKPLFARQCYPDTSTCVTYLAFRASDGKVRVLSNHQDANDKTLLRVVCKVNALGDMAHCADFDTGEQHNEIKNPSTGSFVRVAP